MSSDFTYLKDCPICRGERGDCRESKRTGLIHCRTQGDPPVGWKYIKDDSWGFGMFAPDQSDWTQEEHERWRRRQDQRRRQQTIEERERIFNALPIRDRNLALRRIQRWDGISLEHQNHLLERGLTESDIQRGGFFTLQRGETTPPNTPSNLPGLCRNRYVGIGDGLAIPTHWFSKLSGFQVRYFGDLAERGKYRWAINSKLPNGELPISLIGEPVDGVLHLSEGILKPFVAQKLHGGCWLGASSGNFSNCPKQFREVIEWYQIQSVIIYPDAGDVANIHVMPRWVTQVQFIKSVIPDVQISIAWWGQSDQGGLDCDDIGLDFQSQVSLITVSEFWDIAYEFGGLSKKSCDVPEEVDELVEPPLDIYAQYLEAEEEEERIELARSQLIEQEEQIKREQRQRLLRLKWENLYLIYANHEENREFVNFPKPEPGTIFMGRSGLGTGKTHWLGKIVDKIVEDGDRDIKFLALGSRNTLLLQMVRRIPRFYHFHLHEGNLMKNSPGEGIALCTDSLIRLNGQDLEDRVLVLDEVCGTIDHTLHSRTIKPSDRNYILHLFKKAVKRAKYVICLDGNLSQPFVDYMTEISGKSVFVAENLFKDKKPEVTFIEGSLSEEDGKISKKDLSAVLEMMLAEPVPIVTSDSQIMIETLDEIYTQQGRNVLRIDRKTIGDDSRVKEFLTDCNDWIEKNRPDVLLISPSGESGIDISVKSYFTRHYHLGYGVVSVDTTTQQIGRLRDKDCPKLVWVADRGIGLSNLERGGQASAYSELIERTKIEMFNNDVITSLKDGASWTEQVKNRLKLIRDGELATPEFSLSCVLQAKMVYERSHYRDCVKWRLQEAGYKLTEQYLSPKPDVKNIVKEVKESVKQQNAHNVFVAEQIPFTDLERLSFDASYKKQCEHLNANFRMKLPGIEQTDSWVQEFLYRCMYKDRGLIGACQLFWMLQNKEASKRLAIDRFRHIHRTGKLFLASYRSSWGKVKALEKLGFESFLNLNQEWLVDDPSLQELFRIGMDQSIINVLGKKPGKQAPMRYFGSLLKLVGLRLRSRKLSSGARLYSIDPKSWEDRDRKNILDCLDRRWESFKTDFEDLYDWSIESEESEESEHQDSGKIPQTLENGISSGELLLEEKPRESIQILIGGVYGEWWDATLVAYSESGLFTYRLVDDGSTVDLTHQQYQEWTRELIFH